MFSHGQMRRFQLSALLDRDIPHVFAKIFTGKVHTCHPQSFLDLRKARGAGNPPNLDEVARCGPPVEIGASDSPRHLFAKLRE